MTKFMKTYSVVIRRGPSIHGAATENQRVAHAPDLVDAHSVKSSIREM